MLPTLPPNDNYNYDLNCINGRLSWTKGEPGPSSPPPAVVAPKKRLMLILAGQSNCQSSNDGPLTANEKLANPNIKSVHRGVQTTFDGTRITNYTALPKGSIGPAIDPLQHVGISNVNSVGFGRSFCEEYLKDHPDTEITIVPCALGGTGFKPSTGWVITWDKTVQGANMNLYNNMITDCNSVLKANPDMDVLGCLWHQGENDIGNWEYHMKLDKLVKDMRADLYGGKGLNMPFICGTMMMSWKAKSSATSYIDDAHKNIEWRFNDGLTKCAWFDWITADPYQGDGMDVHFDAPSQRMMGSGYYGTFKLTNSPHNTPSSSRDVVNVDLDNDSEDGVALSVSMSFNEICATLAKNEGTH
jgi:hypothetical protein